MEGHIFEKFFTTEKLLDGLPVFWKYGNMKYDCIWDDL